MKTSTSASNRGVNAPDLTLSLRVASHLLLGNHGNHGWTDYMQRNRWHKAPDLCVFIQVILCPCSDRGRCSMFTRQRLKLRKKKMQSCCFFFPSSSSFPYFATKPDQTQKEVWSFKGPQMVPMLHFVEKYETWEMMNSSQRCSIFLHEYPDVEMSKSNSPFFHTAKRPCVLKLCFC